MSSKIESCPFCGSNECSPNYHDCRVWVDCDACGARGKTVSSKWIYEERGPSIEEAISLWNKRAAPVVERQLNPEFRGGAVGVPRDLLESICSYEWRGDLAASNAQQLRGILDGRITGWQPPELAELQATIATLESKLNNAINLDFERRTEIERLQREEKNDAIAYKAAIEKQAELRAELEHTGHDHDLLRNENVQLQAEIERLKGGHGEPVYQLATRMDSTKEAWFDVTSEIQNEYEQRGEPWVTRTLYTSQPAPVSVVHPFADKVIRKLQRYQECAEDGQGADIGRHWFDLLTQLGLLNRVQRSPALWEITQQGEDCLDKVKELNQ